MRADNPMADMGIYQFGEFRLDARERVLEFAGRPIPLAPKALDVLIVLLQSRGTSSKKNS